MKEMSDDLLFLLSLEHNEEAYKCLFNRYEKLIRQIANSYSKLSSISYPDLLDELYLLFYQSYCQFDHFKDNSFFTFIYISLKNKVRTLIGKTNNKDKYEITDEELFYKIIEEASDYKYDPENIMIKELNYNDYKEKLELKFSAGEKQVYSLLIDGFTYDEITDKLDISKKQLYNNICRIRSKVKYQEEV